MTDDLLLHLSVPGEHRNPTINLNTKSGFRWPLISGADTPKLWHQCSRNGGMQNGDRPHENAVGSGEDAHPQEQDSHPDIEHEKPHHSTARSCGRRRQTGNPQRKEANPGKASKWYAYSLRLRSEQQHAEEIGHYHEGGTDDDFKPRCRYNDRSQKHSFLT